MKTLSGEKQPKPPGFEKKERKKVLGSVETTTTTLFRKYIGLVCARLPSLDRIQDYVPETNSSEKIFQDLTNNPFGQAQTTTY